jgi:hypothetical protein
MVAEGEFPGGMELLLHCLDEEKWGCRKLSGKGGLEKNFAFPNAGHRKKFEEHFDFIPHRV